MRNKKVEFNPLMIFVKLSSENIEHKQDNISTINENTFY